MPEIRDRMQIPAERHPPGRGNKRTSGKMQGERCGAGQCQFRRHQRTSEPERLHRVRSLRDNSTSNTLPSRNGSPRRTSQTMAPREIRVRDLSRKGTHGGLSRESDETAGKSSEPEAPAQGAEEEDGREEGKRNIRLTLLVLLLLPKGPQLTNGHRHLPQAPTNTRGLSIRQQNTHHGTRKGTTGRPRTGRLRQIYDLASEYIRTMGQD